MKKICTKCKVSKDDSEFYLIKVSGKLSAACRACYCARVSRNHDPVKKKAYNKEYYATATPAIRDKMRASGREYYERNKEIINEVNRKRYADGTGVHRERQLERSRMHYENNKERYMSRIKAYRDANPDKIKERRISYSKANPDKMAAKNANYRDAKRQRGESHMSEFDVFVVQEATALRVLREKVIGGKWHVDHIEPLLGKTVSGLHNAFNLAVVPATYNSIKSNKQVSTPWYLEC